MGGGTPEPRLPGVQEERGVLDEAEDPAEFIADSSPVFALSSSSHPPPAQFQLTPRANPPILGQV